MRGSQPLGRDGPGRHVLREVRKGVAQSTPVFKAQSPEPQHPCDNGRVSSVAAGLTEQRREVRGAALGRRSQTVSDMNHVGPEAARAPEITPDGA